jgi:hypothetical protein
MKGAGPNICARGVIVPILARVVVVLVLSYLGQSQFGHGRLRPHDRQLVLDIDDFLMITSKWVKRSVLDYSHMCIQSKTSSYDVITLQVYRVQALAGVRQAL